MIKRKVFCIGFQKTGTSSLGLALGKLGYKVAGFYQFREFTRRNKVTLEEVEELALKVAAEHDAAQDTPWPILYRQLDQAFPGSRFIHITRDRDAWLQSALKDFGESPISLHDLIYGTPYPKGNETAWLETYDKHNRDVLEYFADRPDDFISLDLNKGEVNWEKVCAFLDVPVPELPWPHANRSAVKKQKMRYWKVLRRLGLK